MVATIDDEFFMRLYEAVRDVEAKDGLSLDERDFLLPENDVTATD